MIYVTGDLHADILRLKEKNLKFMKKNDSLIVCGDFGFIWNGDLKEKRLLEKIGKSKFYTLFVDGTHENFDLLEQYEIVPFKEGMARHISGNIYQLLRGQIYKIEEKTFFTFGGGESPDKDIRISANKWWPQESSCIEEMKNAVSNLGKYNREVDYIISHEPPGKIKNLAYNGICKINTLNWFFDDVAKEISFKNWYFGSTHVNKQFIKKFVSVFDRILPIE